MKKLLSEKYILLFLLALDITFVALHILLSEKGLFNLDFEGKLPTVYQSSKLILVANMSILIIILNRLGYVCKKEIFWIFWFLVFFVLGVDELGQIHENISLYIKEILGSGVVEYESSVVEMGYESTPWLLYYSLIFIGTTAFLGFFLKDFLKEKFFWSLVLGWVLFLAVPVVEYFNTMPGVMFAEGYDQLVILEEFLEMAGASFLFAFTYSYLKGRMEKSLEKNFN